MPNGDEGAEEIAARFGEAKKSSRLFVCQIMIQFELLKLI